MVSFRPLAVGLIFLFVNGCFGQTNPATLTCVYDEIDEILTMTLRKLKETGIAERLVAIDVDSIDTTPRNCISFEDTVGADTYLELVIETDLSKAQLSPIPDCFIKDEGGAVVGYNILQESTENVIKANDVYYNLTCDSSDASGAPATINNQDVSIVLNLLDETPVTESEYSVTAALVEGVNVITSSVNLDTDVKVRLTFTRPGIAGIPLFIQVTSLEVSSDQYFNSTSVIEILDIDGCPSQTTAPFNITSGVVVSNIGAITTLSTSVEGDTGTFKISIFTVSSQLFFRAQWIAVCYNKTENQCFNAQAYCATLAGRRRRQATDDDEPITGTVDFSVGVRFSGDGDVNTYDTDVPLIAPREECSDEKSIWIVSIVLGVLLVLVLAFAVMLFYKLRRERRTKMADDVKFGMKNPSF